MKSPEEIKKGLECCKPQWKSDHFVTCNAECPYRFEGAFCRTVLNSDTLARIQQLEMLAKPNEQIRWERDIAIDQLRQLGIGFGEKVEAQVPKWISVEEMLPKRNACVVVTDGKHTWDYGQFNGLAFCFNNENPNPRKWNWKKHAVRHVEWWMPKETALPEPPKEG